MTYVISNETIRNRKNILVVEESRSDAKQIKMLLKSKGYSVKTASDGVEALSIVYTDLFHLIICTIQLPVMDGFLLTQQIRKSPVLATVPIILLTHLPKVSDVVQSLSCGASTIITKPYNHQFLLTTVDSLLKKNQAGEKNSEELSQFKLFHDGRVYHIPASRENIQEFLDTTCEQIIAQNLTLQKTQRELQDLIARLEDQALGYTSVLRQTHNDLKVSGEQLTVSEEHVRQKDVMLAKQQSQINEGEERFKTAFENAGVGIMITAPDMTLLEVNNQMCAMLGYSKEELLEKSIAEITHPDDMELIEHRAQESGIALKTVVQYEKRYLHRDGNPIWTSVSSVLLCFESGQPRFYISHVKDIRGQKKAERDLQIAYEQIVTTEEELWLQYNENREKSDALLKSEWKYRNLVETVQEGIWATDREARTTYVNHRMAEMLGYSAEEMIGLLIYDFIVDQKEIPGYLNIEKIEQGFNGQNDCKLLKSDGGWIYASMATSVLTDREGNSIGLLAGVMDITDRKRMEEEVTFSNIILSIQQEVSPDGILFVDEKGKMTSFNQRFVDIWSIPDGVIAARQDDLTLTSMMKNLAEPDEFLEKVQYLYVHREEKSRDEITLVDGRKFDRYSAPMVGDDGRFFGRVWHFHDITHKKQIEGDIRTLNLHLEERVKERTNELEQANEELRAINEVLKAVKEKLRVQDDVTKEAYDALEKSEERFRIVAQSVSDVIWDWDLKKNRLDWYGRIDTMLGYEPEDFPLSIDAWENIIHPDDLDRVLTELDRHITAHISHETEYRVIKKDGTIRFWVDRGTAMYAENGRACRMVGSCTDITERKLAEEALRDTTEYLQNLISYSNALIIVWNPDLQIAEFNQAFEELSGRSRDEVIGKHLDFLFPEDSKVLSTLQIQKTSAGERWESVEIPILTITGNVRTVLWNSANIENTGGVIIATIAQGLDITDRKRAEEAVRISEEKYRLLFESSPVGIGLANLDGTIIDLNRTMQEVTGYSSDDLKDLTLSSLYADPEDLRRLIDEILMAGVIRDYEVQLKRKNGTTYDALLNIDLIDGGNQRVLLKTLRDITQHKKMTNQIEASLLEKETLLREIHHRVKNNLQIISSILNLQIRKIDHPDTIDALRDSQNRVKTMGLVHEHLYRSKDISHVDLGNFIRSLVNMLFQSYLKDGKNITFETSCNNNFVDINKAIPLGLIINELITNCIKYAFVGKDTGTISVLTTESPEALTLIVADNGVGIWEKSPETTDSLGLHLVKTLTDQLDGLLTVEVQNGTTFTFVFPKTTKC